MRQNKEMILILIGNTMRTFFVSCSFLMFLFLVSCGEKSKNKEAANNPKISNTKPQDSSATATTVILFFGNSLTAGYGLEPEQAFPALIQEKLDSLNFPYKVINAGLSGETTAGGKSRISWVLKQDVEVFVLELGANDGLRGIPLKETRDNLQAIMDTVRAKNLQTKIILTGMQLPPNLGSTYTGEFKNIFPELAKKNNVSLVPFLLEDVGGVAELNQQDGIHPTAEGQKILANNVWEVLKPLLEK